MLAPRLTLVAPRLLVGAMCMLGGCNLQNRGLEINEVMASNDNAWHDEWGEDEDYIELINTAGHTIRTGGYVLTDASGKRGRLPDIDLNQGEVLVMVADASPEQGAQHLPFKISSTGDVIVLGHAHGFAVERVELPPLGINATFQRFPNGSGKLAVCEHATPGAPNGASCPAGKPNAHPLVSGPQDD